MAGWLIGICPGGDTRLVVLDLKVKADRVHLFTHTLEPVWVTDGKAVYGCTEFIFPLDVSVPERSDPAAILGRIERWLPYGSALQSEWKSQSRGSAPY
jgi:hypothetical protein